MSQDEIERGRQKFIETADVFVTREKRLYEHVERIPDVPGFQVVRSLAAALSAGGLT